MSKKKTKPTADTILKIEIPCGTLNTIHVDMGDIVFDITFDKDYAQVIEDICRVAPRMMSLELDLMEAYDDAFRTMPKGIDKAAVRTFLAKYRGRIPEDLPELFDIQWAKP